MGYSPVQPADTWEKFIESHREDPSALVDAARSRGLAAYADINRMKVCIFACVLGLLAGAEFASWWLLGAAAGCGMLAASFLVTGRNAMRLRDRALELAGDDALRELGIELPKELPPRPKTHPLPQPSAVALEPLIHFAALKYIDRVDSPYRYSRSAICHDYGPEPHSSATRDHREHVTCPACLERTRVIRHACAGILGGKSWVGPLCGEPVTAPTARTSWRDVTCNPCRHRAGK